MSIEISDLQQVVKDLFPNAEDIKDEAMQRAYVNRSYYATYHDVLSMICTHFSEYKVTGEASKRTYGNTGTHKQVVCIFEDIGKEYGCKAAIQLAYKFKAFLSKRHHADYQLDKDFSDYDYQVVLKMPEAIKQLTEELRENLPKAV